MPSRSRIAKILDPSGPGTSAVIAKPRRSVQKGRQSFTESTTSTGVRRWRAGNAVPADGEGEEDIRRARLEEEPKLRTRTKTARGHSDTLVRACFLPCSSGYSERPSASYRRRQNER